ncbi:MAG: YggS family pyridoxal phosphate-dependent enzyme [Deltaproteobacteria bacterium]|nr:YggS family pyridoxal phosphate-dependent enzyme [Deltaproteobacteria bacterium]
MTIVENLQSVKRRIEAAAERAGRNPADISLVAVSKRMPAASLRAAAAGGHLLFGENYLQEAVEKISALPRDFVWHFIGHIQSNKAKIVAGMFDVVETLDRLKIAAALEKHLAPLNRVMPVYLQVNIGREPQKSGVMPDAARKFAADMAPYRHLRLTGLMAMPPYSPDPENTRKYFRQTRELAEKLAAVGLLASDYGLSMGMSGDFEVAIEEGSTLVRVGTAIFGGRK